MQIYAVTGFFGEAVTPETRFAKGDSPQGAVASLMETVGEFKVLAVIGESEVESLLERMRQWKVSNESIEHASC